MHRSGPMFPPRFPFLQDANPLRLAGYLYHPAGHRFLFVIFHRENAACDARGSEATVGINIGLGAVSLAIHYTATAPPSWLYSDVWFQSYH